LIDSSIVRAPPARRRRKKAGADHAIGRSRGGLSTKINVRVDARGLPVRIVLSQGQAADKAAVPALVADMPTEDVVADRGCEKHAVTFLAAVLIAATRLWIRFESTTLAKAIS
jgi:hypothetical protein